MSSTKLEQAPDFTASQRSAVPHHEQVAHALAETARLPLLPDNDARTKHLATLAMLGEFDPTLLSPPEFSIYFSANDGTRPKLVIPEMDERENTTPILLDRNNPKSREVAKAAVDAHQVANYAHRMRVGASRFDTVKNFFARHALGSGGRAIRAAIDKDLVVK